MTLHLHRAPRTDALADGLADLLATPPADAFATDVVVVPAKGVERWLTQRLSHRLGAGARGGDGVCAGVRFLTPHSLTSLLLDRGRDDLWSPDRLVWPLLATIDASLAEPWCAALAEHLGQTPGTDPDRAERRTGRRWSTARRVASLFSSYAAGRPALIAAWRAGDDTDGTGAPLPDDLAWQPHLWRALLERVGVEPPDVRQQRVEAALLAGDATAGLDLPDRLSLFGHTRISASEVSLLRALAERRDVHLWLPQPSPVLWADLTAAAGPSEGRAEAYGPVPRAADRTGDLVGHPLLASLGRDSRELHRTLAPADLLDLPVAVDEPHPITLLGWLQHDLRANRAPDAAVRADRPVADDDASLQVHACHGAARQIEVLREVLVGLLDDDPTLQPRDILVMCPDIETYAPLVSAGFGLAGVVPDDEAHPAHLLRVRLADRALTSTNPLLAIAASLVHLALGRATASELLDLTARPAVRARFGFGDDDLDRISRWVGETGIRWGLDAASRDRFAMARFEQNTWRAGLDRLLLGVAMSGDDHQHVGRGLPLDDVGSSDLDLVGALAELHARLVACLTALEAATSPAEQMAALADGVRCLTRVDLDDAWQLPQLDRELTRIGQAADGPQVRLRLADVRALLESHLAGRPTRANFRTGTLTVCTMVPMRSVPHRVVCLVGLDDGVFPRTQIADGDDVLARSPLTGERDPRSEDRQLFLDALLSATEKVVITYTGASENSGSLRPPAVPVGELLDAADRTLQVPVRERIHVRHPLQPHDPRNLRPGGLAVGDRERPFSFDRAALAGAVAAVGTRVPPPPLLTGPLPEVPKGEVSLADLQAFFAHPVRAFLRDRLGVSAPLTPDDVDDAIPVQLDGLGRWAIGDRLLREVLAGADPQAVMTAEFLRGSLPPGRLGSDDLTAVATDAQALFTRTHDLREGTARSVDVDIDLGGGRRLVGTVTGLYGSKLVRLSYSSLKAKQRLATWIDLLALSAGDPDLVVTGHTVGRTKAGPKRALAGPVDHRAVEWLRTLVELREEGLRRPLPLPAATGLAWAEGHARTLRGDDVSPEAMAAREWVTDPFNAWGISGEDADAYHQRAFGHDAPLQVLLDAGLRQAAWAVWEPLLSGGEKVGPL